MTNGIAGTQAMNQQASARVRPLAIAAGLIGSALLVNYVAMMAREDNTASSQVVAWSTIFAAPTLLAFASGFLPKPIAFWSLVLATVFFLPLIVLVPFGLLYLLAALLAGVAAGRLRGTTESDPG